jgi:hypothetical protein
VRRGLLFAGTESAVYVSFDDGAHWQSLQLNLPNSSMRDLTIHGADLLVATHGRSFWALDDITPLRQIADSVRKANLFVFVPAPAQRFAGGRGRGENVAANPPTGLILDYWLKTQSTGTVTLSLFDSAGTLIRTFKSNKPKSDSGVTDSAAMARLSYRQREQDDSVFYEPGDSVVPARAGGNRFNWDLKYPGAKHLDDIVDDEGMVDGPPASPGRYSVRIVAGKDSMTRTFTVIGDPRLKTTAAGYAGQFAFSMKVHDAIDSVSTAVTTIQNIQRQLDERTSQTSAQPYATRVADAAKALRSKLEVVRGDLAEVNSHADEITLVYPVRIYNQLLTLNAMIQGSDDPPTAGMTTSLDDLVKQTRAQQAILKTLEDKDLAAFNAMMVELKVPAVTP